MQPIDDFENFYRMTKASQGNCPQLRLVWKNGSKNSSQSQMGYGGTTSCQGGNKNTRPAMASFRTPCETAHPGAHCRL